MTKNLGSPTEETTASGIRDGRAVELFDALSDRQRLLVVDHLAESGGPVTLRELARVVAAMETGKSVENLTREDYQSVHISLHHNHVPKLVKAEIVHYDEVEETIELVDETELSPLLQFVVVEKRVSDASN